MASQGRQLQRSASDRWFCGVIGGIGEYFGLDSGAVTLLRIGYVVLGMVTAGFPLFLIYILLCVFMPDSNGRTRQERKEDYHRRYSNYQDRWTQKSDRKIKDAEVVNDGKKDDWSDF